MSTALAGLLGVVAGSLLTGTLQWLAATRDRRLSARASARAVRSLAVLSLSELEWIVKERRWSSVVEFDWPYFQERWDQHSDRLARVVSANDFYVVVNYFMILMTIIRARDAALKRGEDGPSSEDWRQIKWTVDLNNQVQVILHEASTTQRERRFGGRPHLPPLPPAPTSNDS